MARQLAKRPPALRIPQPGSPVAGRRNEAGAIRTEGNILDFGSVATENTHLRAARSVEHIHRLLVPASECDTRRVRTERCNAGFSAAQNSKGPTCHGVIDARCLVVR